MQAIDTYSKPIYKPWAPYWHILLKKQNKQAIFQPNIKKNEYFAVTLHKF